MAALSSNIFTWIKKIYKKKIQESHPPDTQPLGFFALVVTCLHTQKPGVPKPGVGEEMEMETGAIRG
jgi:hypothetical protein